MNSSNKEMHVSLARVPRDLTNALISGSKYSQTQELPCSTILQNLRTGPIANNDEPRGAKREDSLPTELLVSSDQVRCHESSDELPLRSDNTANENEDLFSADNTNGLPYSLNAMQGDVKDLALFPEANEDLAKVRDRTGTAEQQSVRPSSSSEDTSFLHDARSNLLRRESEQEKQRAHLTYVINAEHANRLEGTPQFGLEPDAAEGELVGGKLQPNSRHQFTSLHANFLRVAEQWKLERQIQAPENPDDILVMSGDVLDDQTLFDAVFHEVACQAEAECSARGLLLKSIREKYTKLMGRIPVFLEEIREDLAAQRSTDKQFAEQLVSYQAWWRQQQFLMENVGDQNEDTLHSIMEDCNSVSRQIPVYEDEARQLRNLAALHFISRARAEQTLQELMQSREQWQDTAYLICIKLIKDQKLVKLTEMHAIHQTWYNASKRAYRSTRIFDNTVVESLRTLMKEFVASYQILDRCLLDDEVTTVRILQTVRAAVDRSLFVGLYKEEHFDMDFVKQTRKTLLRWQNSLKKVADRFTGKHTADNGALLRKVEAMFEKVISTTLKVYISRFNRELGITSSHPSSPIKKAGRKMVLFTNVGPNFSRMSPVDVDFGGPIFNATETPVMSPKPDTPVTDPLDSLTDYEFHHSKVVFQASLGVSADLDVFRYSLPYTEMYRVWCGFQVVRRTFENRIRGDTKFREWLTKLCGDLDASVKHAVAESYFVRGSSLSSFTDDAAGLLDQLHSLLQFARNDFSDTATPARNQNTVRKFLMQANAWFLFSQNAIQATTESILERVSILFVAMARAGIELIASVCPRTPSDVTEERLKALLDKQNGDTERLLSIRATIDGTLEDLYKLSAMFDNTPKPPELGDIDEDTANEWHSLSEMEGTLTAQVDKWRFYSAMGVNFACEVRCTQEKAFLPNSNLAKYPMSTLHEKNRFDETGSDFPSQLQPMTKIPKCLQAARLQAWDRGDMIQVRCLGEDENTYMKPFRIATKENVDREIAPGIMKAFLAVQKALSDEKMAIIKANQLLLDFEHEFAEINRQNQKLDVEIKHRQAVKSGTQPPTVGLPEESVSDLEERLTRDGSLPPFFMQNAAPWSYANAPSVADWEHLLSDSNLINVYDGNES